MMKKLPVIHPFLFAVIPILFLYAHNLDEAQFSNVILPSAVMLAVIALTYLLLGIFIKDGKLKGVILTFSLAMFFSYGSFFMFVKGFSIGGFLIGREKFVFIAWVLILAAGIFLLIKLNKKFSYLENLTEILNIASITMILIISINVFTHSIKKSYSSDNSVLSFIHSKAGDFDKSRLPNIYYIILDGYGSSGILKKLYGFDNREFEAFLTKKGFYIAHESRCNYSTTMLSLASSLNMIHLPNNSMNIPLLDKKIQENNVMKVFNLVGYKTVCISSNITQPQHIQSADRNIHCGSFLADEFHTIIIDQTLLRAFNKYINFAYFYREKVLNAFSELRSVQQKTENPFFAFVHILPPHPPYVFGPEAEPMFGSLTLTTWDDPWTQKDKYIDQVIFVNRSLENAIAKILSESKRPSVIIIQSDHGPRYLGENITMKTTVEARINIFNAVYLPGNENKIFYRTVTPVNTFRLLFNKYFKANYPLLEDRSYFNISKFPYKFIDVTDSLKHSSNQSLDFVD